MPKYEIILYWSDEDQVFVAEVPELPGCMAHGATPQASDLIRAAEHVVTFDWSPALLELGDHLVGDAPHGIHHDVARDR